MNATLTATLKPYFLVLLLLSLFVSACGGTPPPDTAATEQAALAATEAAAPTDTPIPPTDTPEPPTETPVPTNTPEPPTDTPTPTDTPEPPTDTPEPPTETPTPTDTPDLPTDTPTPAPPTETPTPATSPAEEAFSRGLDYVDQKLWDQALVEFQEAVRLDPEFGLAYAGLGYSYAFGPADFEQAIAALEKYLELVPDTNDRADVEDDIEQMRQILASNSKFDVPAGKALFVFTNYTDVDWDIDVGPYHISMPAWHGGEYPVETVPIDPGTYIWQAHSPGGGYYITDDNGNHSFEFTVGEGEIYSQGVGGPPQ